MINRITALIVTALLMAAAWGLTAFGNADPQQLMIGAFFYILYTTYRDSGRLDDLEKRRKGTDE